MKTIKTVNNVEIVSINEDNQKLIPIKPICEAIGVATNKQIEKIKEDPILSSTGTLRVSVGADGKKREMFCLPIKYVYGWLFTINPNNVKPEAKEAVIRYKMECYDAIYNHFVNKVEAQYQRSLEEIQLNEQLEKARDAKNEAAQKFKEIQGRIHKFREERLAELSSDAVQLDIFTN